MDKSKTCANQEQSLIKTHKELVANMQHEQGLIKTHKELRPNSMEFWDTTISSIPLSRWPPMWGNAKAVWKPTSY